MSIKHPIIAVTGSSGVGTTAIKDTFTHMFHENNIKTAIVEGDCFHKYSRTEMDRLSTAALAQGHNLTHFGPEGNLFQELEALFREYSIKGTGKRRFYIHSEKGAAKHGFPIGTLTPWEPLQANTDLLFYEGLHGGLVTDDVNVAQYVDLLIGVTPIINLEWMQKIHRDQRVRGYTQESAAQHILSRMYDYVHYITPQFSRTHINIQRVPTVDTSNPFVVESIPNNDESFSVIHIQDLSKIKVHFPNLLETLEGSFMSKPDTIVVPAGKTLTAMTLILLPAIKKLMAQRDTC